MPNQQTPKKHSRSTKGSSRKRANQLQEAFKKRKNFQGSQPVKGFSEAFTEGACFGSPVSSKRRQKNPINPENPTIANQIISDPFVLSPFQNKTLPELKEICHKQEWSSPTKMNEEQKSLISHSIKKLEVFSFFFFFKIKKKDENPYFTLRRLSSHLNLDHNSVYRLLKKSDWKYGRPLTPPILTEYHIKLRLDWATFVSEHSQDIWFHLDEKYFGSCHASKKLWQYKQQKIVPRKSKTWGAKVMVIGIISNEKKPYLQLIPILENYKTASTLNREGTFSILTTKFLPEILKNNHYKNKNLIIQMDNAGGHGGGKKKNGLQEGLFKDLDAWMKKQQLSNDSPKITFVAQPPRSPELNVWDLGLWTSLYSKFLPVAGREPESIPEVIFLKKN